MSLLFTPPPEPFVTIHRRRCSFGRAVCSIVFAKGEMSMKSHRVIIKSGVKAGGKEVVVGG